MDITEIEEQDEQGFCINFGQDLRVIELDKANVAIQTRKFSDTKKEYYWVNDGYYGTLYSALHRLLDRKMRGSGVTTTPELVSKIVEVQAEILNAVKDVKHTFRDKDK